MRISRTLFILAIVFAFTMPFVFAQKSNTKRGTSTQTTPASSPTKSRARRAVKPTVSEPLATADSTKTDSTVSEATAQPSPASLTSTAAPTETQATPNEKPADTTPVTPAQPASSEAPAADPILTLRDQIDAAATPQERIRLQLQLAELFSTSGKRTEAVAELKAVAGLEVFDPQGFYNAGNALARLGDIDEAVNAYRKAIDQRKGKYSRAFNNLGVVLLRVGRWDEAHDAFLSALKVESFRYAEASYNLGRLYAARGQMDLATREWRRAVVVDPQHKAAAQSLARSGNEGRITVEQPPVAVARETNNRPASSPPGSIASVERLAVKRPAPKPSAPSSSTKPLALDPASFGFLQKARSASERGNKLEAVDNYQRLLSRQSGYFAPANLELSFVLISLKRKDEALATLLQVANREGSRYPISYYHVARLYEAKGELKLAEASFAQTVAAYGTHNTQFLLDLSRIREKQGNFQGALEAMEQFIAIVKKDGQDVVWSEERLNALRQKTTSPK